MRRCIIALLCLHAAAPGVQNRAMAQDRGRGVTEGRTLVAQAPSPGGRRDDVQRAFPECRLGAIASCTFLLTQDLPPEAEAKALTWRAESYLRQNQPSQALRDAEAAIDAAETTSGHRLRGLALRRLGREPEAAGAFRRALALDPGDEQSRRQLAELGAAAAGAGRSGDDETRRRQERNPWDDNEEDAFGIERWRSQQARKESERQRTLEGREAEARGRESGLLDWLDRLPEGMTEDASRREGEKLLKEHEEQTRRETARTEQENRAAGELRRKEEAERLRQETARKAQEQKEAASPALQQKSPEARRPSAAAQEEARQAEARILAQQSAERADREEQFALIAGASFFVALLGFLWSFWRGATNVAPPGASPPGACPANRGPVVL